MPKVPLSPLVDGIDANRVAVIGSGIAGLATAYLLSRNYEVTLFEKSGRLGGHANTINVTLHNQTAPVDTGFLVFNERTYPNLLGMFNELGVSSVASAMSFGVSLDDGRLEWAGSNLNTVFAQRRNLLSPRFLGMLRDITRFNSAARDLLIMSKDTSKTLGQLLQEGGYGSAFRDDYLLPMAAAIWSSAPSAVLDFPAETFLRFCMNHALLQINDRPQWYTVAGGSRTYVAKIAQQLTDVRLNSAVEHIKRTPAGVEIQTAEGTEFFDAVVMACHAPQALSLLTDASAQEKEVIGAVKYQANSAVVHTDEALLPRNRLVRSAWNYLGKKDAKASSSERPVCVSYLINRLQPLPFDESVVVTLNPYEEPRQECILGWHEYEHPIFDRAAIQAQKRLPMLQGERRTWFAGAWTGYGFHEDGLRSALLVARDFGVVPDWAKL